MKHKLLLLTAYFFVIPPGNYKLIDASASALPQDKLISNSMDVQSADLDADGDLDLIIAKEFKPNVILLNNGNGQFSNESGRLPQKYHDSEDIAVADFDNDGDIDIVFVSEDDEVHEYYINDGHADFKDVSERIPLQSVCNAVVAKDFDNDGDVDIILGNAGQEKFLANDGKGFFKDETLKRLPPDISVTQDIEAADLDGDLDLDLVIGNEDGNKIYFNDGMGFFKDVTGITLPPANEETRKVDIADVDGDGDMDIFFSNVDFGNNKSKANRLLINNGRGVFVDRTQDLFHAFNDMHTGDASFADLDGDGDLDIVLANLVFGYMQVCYNNGKGVFDEVTDKIFSERLVGEAVSVHIADFNNDKIPDIYFGMFRSFDKFFIGSR